MVMERHPNSRSVILWLSQTAKKLSDMHCYENPQIKEKLSPQQIDDQYAEPQKRSGIKMEPSIPFTWNIIHS